jgi:AraC-like DNA-binding protein
LQELGLDTDKLTANADISGEALTQDDTLLSFDQSVRIISNALQLSGNAALGFMIGSRESISDVGMLGYAIASCKKIRELLQLSSSYFQTSTNLTKLDILTVGDHCHLHISPSHPVTAELFRYLVDEDLAAMVKLVRDYFDPDAIPVAVHFAYPEPQQVQRYKDFFRCPVFFDADVSQIILDQKSLDISNANHNPVAKNMALKLCDEMLVKQNALRGLVGKVQEIILSSPVNFPAIAQVAEQLNMSERSLRRRLKELNTSYQEIFNQVRKELALSYLKNTKLELEDIAQLVGFSDSSSFYRSFKSWTNKAPSEFRP